VLRRRIRSVQSTRKITKAMELIAASRIVRAQNRIAANRPYRLGMEKILRITAAADPAAAKRLLGTPETPQTVGIVAIVGDRGLAGSQQPPEDATLADAVPAPRAPYPRAAHEDEAQHPHDQVDKLHRTLTWVSELSRTLPVSPWMAQKRTE